jgi:hypothetical protein
LTSRFVCKQVCGLARRWRAPRRLQLFRPAGLGGEGTIASGPIGRDPYHQPAAFPIADCRQSSQMVVAALKPIRAGSCPRRRCHTPYRPREPHCRMREPQPCWRVNASRFRLSAQWRIRAWRTAEPTGRPSNQSQVAAGASSAEDLIFAWSDIFVVDGYARKTSNGQNASIHAI